MRGEAGERGETDTAHSRRSDFAVLLSQITQGLIADPLLFRHEGASATLRRLEIMDDVASDDQTSHRGCLSWETLS